MDRTIFHIDLDAFFSSVEQYDNPPLQGKPVVVGAMPGGRGVVSTCSYEARAFGLHSAMPISEALRRCPDAIYLPVRMERYCEVSNQVMEILKTFSPDVKKVSIDEAFLDMTGTEKLWGEAGTVAAKIRKDIYVKTGMSVSIGIASNHYIAKIASGLRKPNALVIIKSGEEAAFMHALPLVKLWGAGERTRELLIKEGITTIESLAAWPLERLQSKFGKGLGLFLHSASRGLDPSIAPAETRSKSISTERTFGSDLSDSQTALSVLRGFCDEIICRAWQEKLCSRTVSVKMRYDDFSTIIRQKTRLYEYTNSTELYTDVRELFIVHRDKFRAIRLLGLGLADLTPRVQHPQSDLFGFNDAQVQKTRKAEEAIFGLEIKGKGRLVRAVTLSGPGRASSRK